MYGQSLQSDHKLSNSFFAYHATVQHCVMYDTDRVAKWTTNKSINRQYLNHEIQICKMTSEFVSFVTKVFIYYLRSNSKNQERSLKLRYAYQSIHLSLVSFTIYLLFFFPIFLPLIYVSFSFMRQSVWKKVQTAYNSVNNHPPLVVITSAELFAKRF
jgi:hypothetical protein